MSEKQNKSDSIQVVSFGLKYGTDKSESYAIPIEQVKEIRQLEEITPVPNSKSFVKGVMNLRGLIIPVIDVKAKLGFEESDVNKDEQRVLVAEVENSLYGLLVDDVDQVMRFSTEDIDPLPEGTVESDGQIKGIIRTENKLITLLDITKLIQGSKEEISNETSESSQIKQKDNEKQDEELPKELLELLDEKEIPQKELNESIKA